MSRFLPVLRATLGAVLLLTASITGPLVVAGPAQAASPASAASTASATVTQPIAGDASASLSGSPATARPTYASVLAERVAGADRIGTSIAISQRAFPNGAKEVYLARADVLADALTAGALLEGPILLVWNNSQVSPEVAAEIQRLNPERVVAIGSAGSVSDELLANAAQGRTSDRIAGSNRYRTAIEISKYAYPTGAANVAYADGYGPSGSGSPDAVSAGILPGTVILYLPRGAGADTDAVLAEIGRLSGSKIRLGSNASFNQYQLDTFPITEQLAGSERSETSVVIGQKAFPVPRTVYLARADVFADSVAAGALVDGPVLLVWPNRAPSAAVLEFIARTRPSNVVALGTTGSVADAALYFAKEAAATGAVPDTSLNPAVARQVSAGGDHTCATMQNGAITCWGSDRFGQVGNGTPMGNAVGYDLQQDPLPGATAGAYNDAWKLFGAGLSRTQNANEDSPAVVTGMSFGLQVASGLTHSCAVDLYGRVACWGSNATGQLGIGDTWSRGTAQHVPGLKDVVDIDANGETNGPWSIRKDNLDWIPTGTGHSCAVTAAGDVYCWGDNRYGQIGDGTRGGDLTVTNLGGGRWSVTPKVVNASAMMRTKPVRALMPVKATKVAVGETFTCALGVDQQVYCWGVFRHNWGLPSTREVPNQPSLDAVAPKLVAGFSGVSRIEAGQYYMCAQSGTSIGCVGWLSREQFMTGDRSLQRIYYGNPVRASWPTTIDWSLGRNSSCDVTNTGQARCWGLNDSGQVGRPKTAADNDNSSVPPGDVVGLIGGSREVSVGWAHSCVLTNYGGVSCWGYNIDGQLGNDQAYGYRCRAWGVVGLGTQAGPSRDPATNDCA